MTQESKRELLKDKVVNLVKEFIQTEGGITIDDLQKLFGPPFTEVASALNELRVC
jgi:hypothetical protein